MSAIKTIKKYARLMGIEKGTIGYIMLRNFAKEIADDIKEARPTVRRKPPVQQLKAEIAALANRLETDCDGLDAWAVVRAVSQRMRQLSAV